MFLNMMKINDEPPTIYSLLNSIVNFGKEDKTKIKDLAKNGRTTIFDFDYPLVDFISKEEFESMILNHFLMRRIGFDTLTSFKIQLEVKLNEIMPNYNKLWESIKDWNLFSDGTKTTHNLSSNRDTETENSLNNISTNSSNITNDRRYSDTPQNQIDEVKNGEYITEYNFDTQNTQGQDNSSSNGFSTGNEKNNVIETTITDAQNKIDLYQKFLETNKNIYTLIFKDLECLFYQLV